MVKQIFFVLLIMGLPYLLLGQNNDSSYVLFGSVVNGVSNTPLIGANILASNNLGTKTNELGEFKLNVVAGSVLKISFVGYKPINYHIPFKPSGDYLIKFSMYKDSVSLSEIEIFPLPSYTEFKKEFISMDKQNEQIKMKGVKMYQDRNITPYDVKFYTLFTNPLTFVYDKLFDKKAKLKRRLDRKRKLIKQSRDF